MILYIIRSSKEEMTGRMFCFEMLAIQTIDRLPAHAVDAMVLSGCRIGNNLKMIDKLHA
jgi:hypothetical protein